MRRQNLERPLLYTAEFETVYRPGTLVAASYRDGVEISRQTLSTTGKAAAIRLTSEVSEVAADGMESVSVTIEVR